LSPRRIRVAAVQLDYQPAYLGRSFSYLREPTIIEETENGLSALVEFSDIKETRESIKAAWVDHLHRKIDSILYFCGVREADLVVFPEYSIPVEVLRLCHSSAENRRMVVVAGSHTVVGDEESREIYEGIGLGNLNLRPADPDSDIRKSVCPIFIPGSRPVIVEKRSKSVWETDMTSGRAASTFGLNIRGTTYKVAILLCIDALQLDGLAGYAGETRPELLIVPSLSRSTGPFENVSQLSALNEIPSVYVNGSQTGGSRVLAKSGTATHSWPMEKDGVKLGESTEAIVIAEIDFNEQVEVRRTVRPHLGMKVVSYAPLLYVSDSDLCRSFIALRQKCSDPRANRLPDEVREQLSMLSKTDPLLFPHLLQTKIRLLLDSAQSGSLRAEDIKMFLETADVPAETCSTFVLRQLLIQDALNKVVGLVNLPGSVREQDRIFKVVKNLSRGRVELPPTIGTIPLSGLSDSGLVSSFKRKTKERDAGSESVAFFDREQTLNLIRRFVNAGDQRAYFVQGMKGIGKSALVRRVFVDVLPRWRRLWVQVTEGISYGQLIAQCASNLDIPVNEIPGGAEAKELAEAVMTRLDSLEATALVLDDCDNLLGPTGDFSDEETKRFVVDLVSKPSRRNAKVFLLSNASLPLPEVSQAAAMHRQLRGLEPQDARNLLDYWIRIQREEMRGQPIDIPEKLVSFLQGHPLAIRIAARLCATYTPDQLIGDLVIFRKLREAIVEVLLDRVILTDSQRALLEFASVFRSGITLELFRKWGGDAALIELDSLLARFLLELSGDEYWMHPAIAHYFYEQIDAKRCRTYHMIAAEYYLRAYGRSQPKNIGVLIEAIYHVAASGDIEQAKSLGIHKEQLRALARAAYARRDWEDSLRYYEAISRIDPKDLDGLAHMALGLGRLAQWAEADAYFDRAVKIKEAYWIYQSYGAIKVNAGLLIEGEKLLMRALDLNGRDSATLAGLATLRLHQGREYEAEKHFKEALELNPENSYALSHYSRFLIARGRKREAKPYAELWVELEPRNSQARELLGQISVSGPEAAKASGG